MTPPSTGPRTLARAKTVDMMAMYLPNSALGTSDGAMVRVME